MIYFNDNFYDDVYEIFEDFYADEDFQFDENDEPILPDDFKIEVYECELEPVVNLTADWICEGLQHRFDEDGDSWDKMYEVLNKHIDFEALNKDIPKLWYPKRKKILTKKDFQ